ncbi:MAG: hypothetical protein HUJ68_10195 [Clostridia bacterium]|nr:hypothetical protein [Clostridia bacterium]
MNKQKTTQTKEKPVSVKKTTSLGTATYVIAIIFCVLESILAICLIALYVVIPFMSTSEELTPEQKNTVFISAIIAGVVSAVILIFGIIATAIICKRTKNGEHLNLGLSICSILFFNIVVGIMATIYSTQIPKKE